MSREEYQNILNKHGIKDLVLDKAAKEFIQSLRCDQFEDYLRGQLHILDSNN